MAHELDGFDLKILSILSAEGRISWRELAERTALSPTPTLRRVRALEEQGFITGYHAAISEARVGQRISVFVSISLDSQAEHALAKFEEEIAKFPEVMSCFIMTGSMDYLVRVIVPDIESYHEFISKRLTRIPHVKHVSSGFALKAVVQRTAPPLPPYRR